MTDVFQGKVNNGINVEAGLVTFSFNCSFYEQYIDFIPCNRFPQVCEHCSYRNAKEYQWQNKTIILAADYASNGIYNFIIPLRAHFRSKTSLNPIILLLERRPDIAFLDAISYFPLVSFSFWRWQKLRSTFKSNIHSERIKIKRWRLWQRSWNYVSC